MMKTAFEQSISFLPRPISVRKWGMRWLYGCLVFVLAGLLPLFAQLEDVEIDADRKAPVTRKILMVASSISQMPNGEPSGIWLEDFCATYDYLTENGYEVLLATPRGGRVPINSKSSQITNPVELWPKAVEALENSVELSERQLGRDFDAIFILGGFGVYYDLMNTSSMRTIVKSFLYFNRPIVAIADGPAALLKIRINRSRTVLTGKRVTGITREEIAQMGLRRQLPVNLKNEVKAEVGTYSAFPAFQPHVEVDDYLITGQNWPSCYPAAKALIKKLQEKR